MGSITLNLSGSIVGSATLVVAKSFRAGLLAPRLADVGHQQGCSGTRCLSNSPLVHGYVGYYRTVFQKLDNRYTLSAELLVTIRFGFWTKEVRLLKESEIYIALREPEQLRAGKRNGYGRLQYSDHLPVSRPRGLMLSATCARVISARAARGLCLRAAGAPYPGERLEKRFPCVASARSGDIFPNTSREGRGPTSGRAPLSAGDDPYRNFSSRHQYI